MIDLSHAGKTVSKLGKTNREFQFLSQYVPAAVLGMMGLRPVYRTNQTSQIICYNKNLAEQNLSIC